MDHLPHEILLYILGFLDPVDVARTQQVSKQFLTLARDRETWKHFCFTNSKAAVESAAGIGPSFNSLLSARPAANVQSTRASDSSTESQAVQKRYRYVSWDPVFPGEHHDFYEDYITRHGRTSMSWLNLADIEDDSMKIPEVTATAFLDGQASGQYALSALDDGSVALYDLNARSVGGDALRRSAPGLLTPGIKDTLLQYMQTNITGSAESISIVPGTTRAFFGVANNLLEIDFERMSLISSRMYPYRISALSECSASKPLIVGTNETIHLDDSRVPTKTPIVPEWESAFSSGTWWNLSPSWITLSEPGPLSIVHPPDQSDSIWIAGRFSTILQYSLRSFPQLVSTLHSGARMSCMTVLPYPFVPAIDASIISDLSSALSQRERARSTPGWTAICVGQYKGRGSLEQYGFSSGDGAYTGHKHLNRHSAASSKIFSVASHCGKLVYSDGNGNLFWTERSGTSTIRKININEEEEELLIMQGGEQIAGPQPRRDEGSGELPPRGLLPFYQTSDIARKIVPFSSTSALTSHATEKLLLWTGEGRLGVLGYGPLDPLRSEEWHDAMETQVEDVVQKAKRDAEKQFQAAMRRALQRNADEVRFVRGLGLA